MKVKHAMLLALGLAAVLAIPVCAAENIPDRAAFIVARRLLEAKGVDLANHSLTRDNLAYALIQGARLKRIKALLDENSTPPDEAVLEHVRTERWKAKVARDLKWHASNADIAARLRIIDAAFTRFTSEIDARAEGAAFSFILTGSIIKGHFSARSDIDLIIDTKDDALATWAMKSVYSTNTEHPNGYDEQIAIADAGNYKTVTSKLKLMFMGQTARIDGKRYEPGFLIGMYKQLMKFRGVLLTGEDFQATYEAKNYLYRMEREMAIWIVKAIDQAKNARKRRANLSKKKEGDAGSCTSASDLLLIMSFWGRTMATY